MERSIEYHGTKFSVDTIRAAVESFRAVTSENGEKILDESLKVALMDGQWKFDNESEFFAAVPQGTAYSVYIASASSRLQVSQFRKFASISVQAASRASIQRVFSHFDTKQDAEAIPADSPVVFIGHGRSSVWKDLRDHLRDQHDYRIECYESGARAGHSIRDILESMAEKSSFALLVMTGEDEQESGTIRARQNVIHEAGLFQGRLGFSRAIILLEEGVEQFSNVQGVQYIPFAKGRIREAYGDVLATLRREFGGR
ncbi:nucleotide-binding protein [Stenotrophomonas maltophilia]|uniref:TIR domain-containing protein n=1 Tax=Stenotrophomonas maltophilia TaxID=40324 RepID=UPI0015E6C79E|nr:nucleotide-binding protein [Stenotrophomonas maltophilia]MCU1128907.1 nucleotide-binding protein [Stenotrophomonas maltophilia]